MKNVLIFLTPFLVMVLLVGVYFLFGDVFLVYATIALVGLITSSALGCILLDLFGD